MSASVSWFWSFLLVALLSSGSAWADDLSDTEKSGRVINRGLEFLQADAARWRKGHDCATCHHGVMTVLAFAEAKQAGITANTASMKETVLWTKERLSKIDEPRDLRPGWNMVSAPAIYLGMLGQFLPGQDVISEQELHKIRGHLVRHQEANGSWSWSASSAKNRPPPFFESDEVATLLALLVFPDDGEVATGEPVADELRASRQKAVEWLAKADSTDTTQAALFRMLWKKRGKATTDLQPLIERFLRRQRLDGGFAQLADQESDAYATGQSLYVLSLLNFPKDRPEIRRAASFLIETQRDDGSWPMIGRSHDGVTPSKNIVPITYFGTAWATMGLIRSTRENLHPAD